MPAAPFWEGQDAAPCETGVRQWAIDSEQCRWILADAEAGAEALMCGAKAALRRSFCPDHCARAYLKCASEDEPAVESEQQTTEAKKPEAEEAE